MVEQSPPVAATALDRSWRVDVLVLAGQIEEPAHAVVGGRSHAAGNQVPIVAPLFDKEAPGVVISATEPVRTEELIHVPSRTRVDAQHDAPVPGRAAVVVRTRRGVAVVAAVVDEESHPVVRARGVAVPGGAVLVVAGQVELESDPEEVAGALREVGAAVAVVAIEIEDHAPAAGQPVCQLVGVLGENALARAGSDPEAVVLEERVAGLPAGGVGVVVAAGVFLAALVPVVAGDVHDRADAQWPAEADRVAEARVHVVAGLVQQQPQPADRSALREPGADIPIVARSVNEEAQSAEASAAGPGGQVVLIVAGAIDEQPA